MAEARTEVKHYPNSERLAPGVLRLFSLSRNLSESTKTLCLDKLEELLTNGVVEHSDLPREPGVNFNPLPARLLEILYRECKIENEMVLLEALDLSEPDSPRAESNQAIAAWWLDRLRHHRKIEISSEEKLSELEKAKQTLSSINEGERLQVLLQTIIQRLSK